MNFEVASVSDTSSVTSPPPTISVPYRWQRCTFGTNVYYISPSARVLLDLNELYYYLSSKHTCKCYLEPLLKMNYLDAFNFDPNVKSTITKHAHSDLHAAPSECLEWTKKLSPHMLKDQVQQTVAYLAKEVTSLEGAQTVMNRTQQIKHLDLYAWMKHFDWEKILIMSDGRKVMNSPKKSHLIHLTRELVMTGQLKCSLEWKNQQAETLLMSSKKVQKELEDKENEDINSVLNP